MQLQPIAKPSIEGKRLRKEQLTASQEALAKAQLSQGNWAVSLIFLRNSGIVII